MNELSDAGLLDEFFEFLHELGMSQAFEQVSLPGVKRVLVPTVQFILLYLLKVLFGGQSMNELPRVLFSNLGLMELVGFNYRSQCIIGSSSHLGNVELIALTGSLFHAQANGLFHTIEELLPKCEDEPRLDNKNTH